MFLAEGLFAINTLENQVGVPQYILPYGYGVPQYPSTYIYVLNAPVMKEEGVKGVQYVMIPSAKQITKCSIHILYFFIILLPQSNIYKLFSL